MRAYKFLDAKGRAPFTLTAWEPGRWQEVPEVVPCRRGMHACTAADLAWWLAPTLWEVELDGAVVATRHKLAARRGRVIRPVEGYEDAALELGAACAWRSRDRAVEALHRAGLVDVAARFGSAIRLDTLRDLGALVDDATHAGIAGGYAADAADFAITGPLTEAPFIAACSAGHASAEGNGDQAAFDLGYAEERSWQSQWLANRLGLAVA